MANLKEKLPVNCPHSAGGLVVVVVGGGGGDCEDCGNTLSVCYSQVHQTQLLCSVTVTATVELQASAQNRTAMQVI